MPTASAPLETADCICGRDVGRARVDRDHGEADARRLVDEAAEHLRALNGGRHVLDQEGDLLQAVLLGAQRHGTEVGREAALEGEGTGRGELGRGRSADRDVGDAGAHDRRHLGLALPGEGLDDGDDAVLDHVVGAGLAAGRRRLVLADVEGDLVALEAVPVGVQVGDGGLGALLDECRGADGAAAATVADEADRDRGQRGRVSGAERAARAGCADADHRRRRGSRRR